MLPLRDVVRRKEPGLWILFTGLSSSLYIISEKELNLTVGQREKDSNDERAGNTKPKSMAWIWVFRKTTNVEHANIRDLKNPGEYLQHVNNGYLGNQM